MEKLTIDDFFFGLLSTLSSKGLTTISLRGERFDKAVAEAFAKLQAIAPKKSIDVRFRIRLHPFHNDSITTRNAIYTATQNGLISLDNPEYQDIRFQIKAGQATEVLKNIPGGEGLFSELADVFMDNYFDARGREIDGPIHN